MTPRTRPHLLLALAAAPALAACGTAAHHAPKTPTTFSGTTQPLSLKASCSDWVHASASEQRSFTNSLFRTGSTVVATAPGDLSPAELRLLISVHCGGGNSSATPLGMVVANAIVGTLDSGAGQH